MVYQRNKIWWIDYYANGKRHRESVGTTSKRKAEQALEARKTKVIEGKFFDVKQIKPVKFKEFANKFLETHSKPNKVSWKTDQMHLEKLSDYLGDIYLNEVTPFKVEEFKRFRLTEGVTKSTVNRALACLRTMLYKAVEWDALKDNPMKKVKLYKEDNRRLRLLSRGEMTRLLKECSSHIRNIVVFTLNTGMRRGEVFNLQWSFIDFGNNHIYINKTKNKEKRIIPMNSIVKKLLLHLKESATSEYVFCNEEGGKVRCVRTGFAGALRRADIKGFRFHDLRHAFASYLVMEGVNLNTVRELLGHKTIDMTLRYAHLSQAHKMQAVEVLSQITDTIQPQITTEMKNDSIRVLEVVEN